MATIDVEGQFTTATLVSGDGTWGTTPFTRTGIHTVVLVTIPEASGDYALLLPDGNNSFVGDEVEVITVSNPGSNQTVVMAASTDTIGFNSSTGNVANLSQNGILRRVSSTQWSITAIG
jgi:hypothetical protein